MKPGADIAGSSRPYAREHTADRIYMSVTFSDPAFPREAIQRLLLLRRDPGSLARSVRLKAEASSRDVEELSSLQDGVLSLPLVELHFACFVFYNVHFCSTSILANKVHML